MNRVGGTSHPLDPMGSGRARKAGTMVGYHFPIQVAAGNRKLLSAAEDLLAATQVKIVVEQLASRPAQLALGADWRSLRVSR